jgi:ubiquitin-conjugating enzyme E2 M
MLALKKKMEAKNTAATQPAAPSTAADGQTKQTSGQFQLSKQPSKDLADLRAKTTATTGVFGLAKKGNKGSAAGQKSAAELRAQKDVSDLDLEAAPGATVVLPNPNSNMLLNVAIKVIDSASPWYGATYDFVITVPDQFPIHAPRAECKTMVYHPNIDWEGHVCLNILRRDWVPVLTLSAVVVGLATLFTDANPNDPLNEEAAHHLRVDEAGFRKRVKETLKGGPIEFTFKDKSKKTFSFPKLV